MEDQPNTHPAVPESMFNLEDRTRERDWHVFLNAAQPVHLDAYESAKSDEDVMAQLESASVIPESVSLKMVSFYYHGTFREAYLAAQHKCDELSEEDMLGNSKWQFEKGNIMLAEE